MNEIAKFARFPNRRVLYVAPTYRQAKNIIWDDLKEMLGNRGWIRKVNETELQIRLVNNTVITVRSGENYDALRGGKYHFLVMDETADIDSDCWYKVLRATLSDTRGHALFIGSPKGRNYFYDLWSQAHATEDWAAFQFTTLDGGNVDAEEIEAARRDLDERTFNAEYNAQFVDDQSVIFYSFTEDNIRKWPGFADARTPIHIGCDFNVAPMSAVLATVTKDSAHIFDEIEIHSSNTQELIQEIRNRYGFDRPIYVYPDASGAKRTTSATSGVTDLVLLQNAGFKLVVDNINPSVADSIISVNSLLQSSTGERKLFIDPKCRSLRNCLIKMSYKEGTRIPDKTSGYDHLTDCLRYVIHKLFPIKMLPRDPEGGQRHRRA